jgi:hypothetical protein
MPHDKNCYKDKRCPDRFLKNNIKQNYFTTLAILNFPYGKIFITGDYNVIQAGNSFIAETPPKRF